MLLLTLKPRGGNVPSLRRLNRIDAYGIFSFVT